MKKQNFRALSDEEMAARKEETVKDLAQLRFKKSLGQAENTAKIPALRKDMARINTEERRREIERGLPKGSLKRLVGVTVKEAPAEKKKGLFESVRERILGTEEEDTERGARK